MIVAAGFHLDECQNFPPASDNIDLTARNSRAAGEDPPTLQSERPAGKVLRAPAPVLGLGAVHPLISSARA